MSVVSFDDREWQFRIVRRDRALTLPVSRSMMAQIRTRMTRKLTIFFRTRNAVTERAKVEAAKKFAVETGFNVRNLLDDDSWRNDAEKFTLIVDWAVFVIIRYVETGRANWTFNQVHSFTLQFSDDPAAEKDAWEQRTGTLLKNPPLLTIDADMLSQELPPVERIDVWA